MRLLSVCLVFSLAPDSVLFRLRKEEGSGFLISLKTRSFPFTQPFSVLLEQLNRY